VLNGQVRRPLVLLTLAAIVLAVLVLAIELSLVLRSLQRGDRPPPRRRSTLAALGFLATSFLAAWLLQRNGTLLFHRPGTVSEAARAVAARHRLQHVAHGSAALGVAVTVLLALAIVALLGGVGYTWHVGRGRGKPRERLARTLAELYRSEIDATGQPMSPQPLAAVQNAIEHYRVDEILISTLAGEQSKWLQEGLLDDVRGLTDKPVEHVESRGERPEAAEEDRTAAGVS
jgi:hypothetical protein